MYHDSYGTQVLSGMMKAVKHNKEMDRRAGKISVMVASHNEDTMRYTVKKFVHCVIFKLIFYKIVNYKKVCIF